ncbi:cobalamin biosynthesis protein [Rugosimonospora acidiphila]|uniref:Cobalamin biosynthesis protein CobD n=1 Tax=Rugosimonospora acidiphila TaxID=556531 RepID=A0ABP9RR02_9ACTN
MAKAPVTRWPRPSRRAIGLAAAHAGGLLAGAALDAALGDPRRFHPVAGFGQVAAALERRCYAPDRAAGARFAAIAAGAPIAAGVVATLATRRRPWARAALVAATTWAVLGGTSLRREATTLADALDAGDLPAARDRLPHLCGRDPSTLDESELARATVESVAENTSDAVVAPLAWGALAGLPGLLGYRAINTLDAMVGHRSPRYRDFGTASARLDDVANLGPARATAALTVVTAPVVDASPFGALRAWLRDGGRHPSPNAGQCEAAMAGALGVRLGGRNLYHGRVEDRPMLGAGRRPEAADIRRATRLSGAVAAAALAMAVGHAAARPWRRALIARALPRVAKAVVPARLGNVRRATPATRRGGGPDRPGDGGSRR